MAKDAPVGFRDIRLTFDLDSSASAEELATLITLITLTGRYCVVPRTPRSSPPTEVVLRTSA